VFRELDRRYRESHRHYHDWAHIEACLRELEAVRALSPHPGALELAIWFHDAVYEPGAADNEERSAAAAREAALRLGLPEELVRETEALILATRHLGGDAGAAGFCRADTDLILDIDLSIFGKPWRVFAAYEEGIRREYQGVPEQARRRRRRRILQGFLDRPQIYRTEAFRGRYEARARENLMRSISLGTAPPRARRG
jgi:predicted metal-dependent HD superfamily phosphohydrolase